MLEVNFPLEGGELGLEAFLALHQLEAQAGEGDQTELAVTVIQKYYARSQSSSALLLLCLLALNNWSNRLNQKLISVE